MAALEAYLQTRSERERALRHEPLHYWWMVFPVYYIANMVLRELPLLEGQWGSILAATLLLYLVGASLVQRRRRKLHLSSGRFPAEMRYVLDELAEHASTGQLPARLHPRLQHLWERGARAVTDIKASLDHPEWVRLAKEEPFKTARQHALTLADDVMVDAVFAGRAYFRRKGQRIKTFEARCADMRWGETEFEFITRCVEQLEGLADEVRASGQVQRSGSTALRAALERLEEIRHAEDELHQSIGYNQDLKE
jgi:hypothetical protein